MQQVVVSFSTGRLIRDFSLNNPPMFNPQTSQNNFKIFLASERTKEELNIFAAFLRVLRKKIKDRR